MNTSNSRRAFLSTMGVILAAEAAFTPRVSSRETQLDTKKLNEDAKDWRWERLVTIMFMGMIMEMLQRSESLKKKKKDKDSAEELKWVKTRMVTTVFKLWVNCRDSGVPGVDHYIKECIRNVSLALGKEDAEERFSDPLTPLNTLNEWPFQLPPSEWRIEDADLTKEAYQALLLQFSTFRKSK